MAQEMSRRFFSMKTLIRTAFTALSLAFGVASAHSTMHGTPQQNGDTYNFVRGGSG